jgi:hypothetical protein
MCFVRTSMAAVSALCILLSMHHLFQLRPASYVVVPCLNSKEVTGEKIETTGGKREKKRKKEKKIAQTQI